MHQERDGVLHVTVEHVECAEPQADGNRGCECQQDEERQEYNLQWGGDAVHGHHADQDKEGDAEVDQASHHRRKGDKEAREIDFRQEVRVAHEAHARTRQRSGEELPWQQPGEAEDGVGQRRVGAFHADDLVEDHREDNHGEKGLQDGPGDTEHGLLVAHEDVAPGEEVKEFAVSP